LKSLVEHEVLNQKQSQGRNNLMQNANTTMQLEQVNTTSNSIQYVSFSALSEQSLFGVKTQHNTETIGTITLNCSGLESINSHGIYLLILFLIYTKHQQKRLQVFGLSEHNRYIFEITRLGKFIDIVETENQTVATIPFSK
jgi:anti-anti-sigma factor